MTPITKSQSVKILKALGYSFVSGFLGVMVLVGADFLAAATSGRAAIMDLVVALISAAVIGGINALLVTVKQLLTPSNT